MPGYATGGVAKGSERGYPAEAVKLSLWIWPRDHDLQYDPPGGVVSVLSAAMPRLFERERLFDNPDRNINGKDIRGFVLSADGKRALVSTFDGVVRLWDLQAKEVIARFVDAVTPFSSYAIDLSSDGTKFVSGNGNGQATLWGLDTKEELLVFSGHDGDIKSLSLSSDGRRLLSGSNDKTARLWNTETD